MNRRDRVIEAVVGVFAGVLILAAIVTLAIDGFHNLATIDRSIQNTKYLTDKTAADLADKEFGAYVFTDRWGGRIEAYAVGDYIVDTQAYDKNGRAVK